MKINSIFIALIALSVLFTSCKKNDDVTPSNQVTTIDKTITGYTQLNVSDPFKVYVTFSDVEEKIQVEANANLHQYIRVEKQNNQLVIYLANNINISGSSVLNVYVSTKHLDAFYAAGASKIQLENELNANEVKVKLAGACTFSGSLYVDLLDADLDGASNMNISGSSNSFEIDATGASNMMDYGFETNNFNCDLEGGCNAHLTVKQTLTVKANGASNVYYKGDGVVGSQHLNGGSSIQKMQ